MAEDYNFVKDRLDDQIAYFDKRAIQNQAAYRFLKSLGVIANILTTLTIALAFAFSELARVPLSIAALVLSTLVLATYQWEEFQNYGAKWEKFRLVAEQLKSERVLYLTSSGRYGNVPEESKQRVLIETVEGIIRGTDVSYFTLLVDPGRRIEKRLSADEKE